MFSEFLSLISNFTLIVIEKSGYAGIFLLMALESANVPIPSEVIMPFSGFLVSVGKFNFWLAVIFGAFGNVFGSLFSYWIGYLIRGTRYLNSPKITSDIEKAKLWTNRFGDWAILVSRLLPVVRTFISLPLGVIGVKSIWKFSALTFAGSFIWSYALTALGVVFGNNWAALEIYFIKFDYLILVLIIGGLLFWLYKHLEKLRDNK